MYSDVKYFWAGFTRCCPKYPRRQIKAYKTVYSRLLSKQEESLLQHTLVYSYCKLVKKIFYALDKEQVNHNKIIINVGSSVKLY